MVGVRVKENSRETQILQFFGCFNTKAIIKLALVRHEIVVANSYSTCAHGIIVNCCTRYSCD